MKSQGLPQFLCSVGISAVTDDTLSRWWKEIIGEKKQWLGTESGGGYMAHPMYVKWGPAKGDEREWVSVNERSFNFGWQNYPE